MSRFRNEVIPVIGVCLYAALYWLPPARRWFENKGY